MAARSKKFACSIDATLLARIERLRVRTGESRSALVSRALRIIADESARTARIDAYVAAYRAHPESEQEIEGVRQLSRRSLALVPWEDE